MKLTISILSVFFLIITIGAPPVVENVNKDKANANSKEDSSDEMLNELEYGRYLKEVVEILENDPQFKEKLENASIDDIKRKFLPLKLRIFRPTSSLNRAISRCLTSSSLVRI
ncbi:unnamed protein product [Rotaria sp. Silwood2]|nr:unnamed protein product [Rotaria sp. Silwood2]